MRVALFCHSLLSDWNHGNAHFLRGVTTELISRGHRVDVYEPRTAWSVENLIADHGESALGLSREALPSVDPIRYERDGLDLARALDGVDLAIVHEWNEPALVQRIGDVRRVSPRMRLLFHDTHHRSVTDPASMAAYDLSAYDGVLAFGRVLRDIYLNRRWARRAFVWHEAADTRVFAPAAAPPERSDVVWIGNWGDGERNAELAEYLIAPIRALALKANAYGVRYPEHARIALCEAGIAYRGWISNPRVPKVFAGHRVTVHVPRRPYANALPGIPTIRVFEALACGIPLVSAPWKDTEGLFVEGRDYLLASDGKAAERHLAALTFDPAFAREIGESGRRAVQARHTCAHRVDELLAISAELGVDVRPLSPSSEEV